MQALIQVGRLYGVGPVEDELIQPGSMGGEFTDVGKGQLRDPDVEFVALDRGNSAIAEFGVKHPVAFGKARHRIKVDHLML